MRDGIEIRRERRAGPSGTELVWTVLIIEPQIRPRLCLDPRFSDQGIVRGGPLLDLAATESLWGEAPGIRPEDWLAAEDPGTIGFCPTNWGWQFGAWLVEGHRLRGLRDDAPPSDPLWMLSWSPDRGWHQSIKELGSPLELPYLGLEMPQILDAGACLPLEAFLSHPRMLADLRNVFDFADGCGPDLDPKFWVELRRRLPATSEAAHTLLAGGSLRVNVDSAVTGVGELFRLVEEANLPGVQARAGALIFTGPLPKARLPLFAIGARQEGALVVVAIDGRQTGVPGGTIEEAAALLRDHGAYTGGLGSAGGDVCLVERTSGGMDYLNTPSTLGEGPAERVSRRVPSLILI